MVALIDTHRARITALCRQYGVRRLDVFGSAIGPDFDPATSDVDLVVDFDPTHDGSPLHRYFDLKRELEEVFGRPVDLVELDALPDTRLKRHIVRSKLPVYAAAPA
jgi:predicted nucleotidyltransferase